MTEGVIQYNFKKKITNSKYHNPYIIFNLTCQFVNEKITEYINSLIPKKYLCLFTVLKVMVVRPEPC